jgi:hypothetical protein
MAPPKGFTPWNKGLRTEKRPLTAEVLRTLVHYDPETGLFKWKTQSWPRNPGPIEQKTPKGYTRFSVLNKRYMAHRLAWLYVTGAWPRGQIDHINGDRSDNRWANLRDVTPSENARNRHAPYRRGYQIVISDEERQRRSEHMRRVRLAQLGRHA